MENLVIDRAFWSGKRVFLTGHTGFKGSWLAIWLTSAGAEVYGFALAPPTSPSLFVEAGIAGRLAAHTIGDVRDFAAVEAALRAARPDVVIHMAAQPLVRYSYAEPVETYAVNVMGTVHVLEAARRVGSVSALVNVTTDKCYQNREWEWGYREDEPMGGHDPYSNSKGCSELVTSAYRSSFHAQGKPWIASGRAGNVIGGGDWALDRLIPDALRAIDAGSTMTVRHPDATRPWQYVLEPLAGYIRLAQALVERGDTVAQGFNFGPRDSDAKPVKWILEHIASLDPKFDWRVEGQPGVHEANFLKLDSSRARSRLGWAPRWPLSVALQKTLEWHQAWRAGDDVHGTCLDQIAQYEATQVDG